MRQDSVFSTGRHMDTPRFTTSALTLRSEETALRVQLRRLPRCGKGGAADRGSALHEVEFPIKRKPGQTCASLRPGRLPYNDRPRAAADPPAAGGGPLPTTMKRPYAASSPAFPAQLLGGKGCALWPFAPPPRPGGRGTRPPGGPVRGACGPLLMPRPCAAARPPGRWRGQARANNRGLARIRFYNAV